MSINPHHVVTGSPIKRIAGKTLELDRRMRQIEANRSKPKKIEGSLVVAGTITGTAIATGTITAGNIAALAINAGHLQANSVTATKIAAGSVAAFQIIAGTITANEIASHTITAGQITAGTITAAEIAAGSITATLIAANAINAGHIQANAIDASKIVAGTITATQIAAGTITGAKIAAGTITAANIAAGTITASEIAAGSITATQIATSTITATQIAAGTITAAKIAAHTITANEIAAATITATEIAAAVITGSLIAAGTITATNIAAATITGGLIAAGTITGSNLIAGTITATQIAAGTITGTQLSAVAIDAMTITGATFRTSASDPKVVLDSTGVYSRDSGGTVTFKADAATGKIITISGLGGDNKLTDASFEKASIPDWTGSLATLARIASPGAKHGANICQLTSTASASNNYARVAALVAGFEVGKDYTLSFWISSAASARNARIAIEWYTSGGAPNGSSAGGNSTWTTSTTVWQRHTFTVTAPANSAKALVYFGVTGAPSGEVFYIDAAQVEEGQIATGFAPRSDEILPGTVSGGNVGSGAQIATGTVINTDLVANTITASRIAAGTITAVEIAANTITAGKIAAGTITATEIASGTITTSRLTATAIDGMTVTGATVRTASSGARVYMNGSGLFVTDTVGTTDVIKILGGLTNGITLIPTTGSDPINQIDWKDGSGNIIGLVNCGYLTGGTGSIGIGTSAPNDAVTTGFKTGINMSAHRTTDTSNTVIASTNNAARSQGWSATLIDGLGFMILPRSLTVGSGDSQAGVGVGTAGSNANRVHILDSGAAAATMLRITNDDDGPWMWQFFNNTYSTTVPGFKGFTNNSGDLVLYTGTSRTFQFQNNCTAPAFTPTSDRKLKKDITTLDPKRALESILALRGVKHAWRENLVTNEGQPPGRTYGFIAQEVQDVLPELVSSHGDDNTLAVDYMRVVPVLVAAIRSLTARLDLLERSA